MNESLQPRYWEPEPRYGACSAIVGQKQYMWGGRLHAGVFAPMNTVLILDTASYLWSEQQLSGPCPPGVEFAACAVIGHSLFIFGGITSNGESNLMYKLDLTLLKISEVEATNMEVSPMPKTSVMIAISNNMLLVVCGHGRPTRQQLTGLFIEDENRPGMEWTNEVHCFTLDGDHDRGTWSSPDIDGKCPPPCDGASLTKIDCSRITLFGGYDAEQKRVSADVYILDFLSWRWSVHYAEGPSKPWPRGKTGHSAVALLDPETNPAHPCLLITCGWGGADIEDLSTTWICSIDEIFWENESVLTRNNDVSVILLKEEDGTGVSLTDSFVPRHRLVCGIVRHEAKVHLFFHGGYQGRWSKQTKAIAAGIVVDLEFIQSKVQTGRSTGWMSTAVHDLHALYLGTIYEESLKIGFIESSNTVCLLNGIAGTGKTHVKCLISKQPLPKFRHSTPMSEPPVRALTSYRCDTTDEEWHDVDDDEEIEILAAKMAAGVPHDDELKTTVSPPGEDILPPEFDSSHIQERAAPPLQESLELLPHCSIGDTSSTFPLNTNSQPQGGSQHKSSVSGLDKAHHDPLQLINHMSSTQKSNLCRNIDWVFIFDSGGQPAFHEIMPFFFPKIAVILFIMKLSESLKKHPKVSYFYEGEQVGAPYPYHLTNLEIFHRSFHSIQSQVSMDSDGKSTVPKMLIVGTHRDQEWRCFESRAEKNRRLEALLTNNLKKHVIYYSPRKDEAIFPLNAKSPKRKDLEVARSLRHTIVAESTALQREKIPIGWHVLRHVLHRVAAKLRRGILSWAECVEESRMLGLPQPVLKAALAHFTSLNTMHYYPEILPEIVFVELQVLLEKITELVERSHELQCNSTMPNKARSGMWLKQFRDRGVITVEHLKEISKRHYVEGLFTPSDFLKLLKLKHIIAPIGDGEYLMPCILQTIGPEKVNAYRASPSSSAAPLAIYFPGGVAPRGLFCSLVASLLSHDCKLPLKLLQKSPSEPPQCTSRNCLVLSQPNNDPGSLTLIDAHRHFEIHLLDAPDEVASKLCPTVRNTVLSIIKEAAVALHYKTLNPTIAFLCESTVRHGQLVLPPVRFFRRTFSQPAPSPHIATIYEADGSKFWNCSRAGGQVRSKLEQRHLVWLSDIDISPFPEATTPPNDDNILAPNQVPEPPSTSHPTLHLSQKSLRRDDKATMPLLQNFNVSERIASLNDVGKFGRYILADSRNEKITAIEEVARGNPTRMCTQILTEWVQGKGISDRTWGGLLDVLRRCNLNTLADDIEESVRKIL